MLEKIKKNKTRILKVMILIILILFIVELIVFQIVAIDEFSKFKNKSHLLDQGSILTFKNLVDKNSGLFDISDQFEIKFEKTSLIDRNTIIDALVINKTGVDLSGINFYIYSKTLTEKGKWQRDGLEFFSKADFENDELCTNWQILFTNDVDVFIESGKAKRVQIIIQNHSISQDEVIKIHGISKYMHYKIHNN